MGLLPGMGDGMRPTHTAAAGHWFRLAAALAAAAPVCGAPSSARDQLLQLTLHRMCRCAVTRTAAVHDENQRIDHHYVSSLSHRFIEAMGVEPSLQRRPHLCRRGSVHSPMRRIVVARAM